MLCTMVARHMESVEYFLSPSKMMHSSTSSTDTSTLLLFYLTTHISQFHIFQFIVLQLILQFHLPHIYKAAGNGCHLLTGTLSHLTKTFTVHQSST